MIDQPSLAALGEALKGWLPGQRWFGGKGRRLRGVAFEDHAVVPGETAVLLALAEVAYDDGPPERYFIPLRPVEGGPLAGYGEALVDELSGVALLAAVDRGQRVPTALGGEIVFERGPAYDELRMSLGPAAVRPLGAEQSNTSVVFGETIIMKAFRRVPDGPNPDLEVPRFLGTRTAFSSIPRLVGAIEYRGPRGRGGSLGILQEFVRSQGDGWAYTLRALADGELEPGSRYLEQVRELGTVTAELHLALASDAGDPAFAPERVEAGDLEAWRAGVAARIRSALAALRRAEHTLSGATSALGRQVLPAEGRLSWLADEILALELGDLSKTRFHGDYHLGQVLRTSDGWMVLDFEGEPLRPLAERRAKGSPLKDVAGMLRSFNYARHAALREHPGRDPAALAAWEQAVRSAFLDAYFFQADRAAFLPRDRAEAEAVLGAFELEKAAYELEYELNNRPDWVELPLSYLANG